MGDGSEESAILLTPDQVPIVIQWLTDALMEVRGQ